MAAAITARTGSGSVIEAMTAAHIEVTGAEANVGVVASSTITAISQANPTQVTASAHGLETGDEVTIAGSNSTPSLNGSQTVTVTGVNTFTVPVNVTVAGSAGTVTFVGDSDNRVAGTEKRYYLLVDSPVGVDDARSHVFQTSSDGKHTWDDYIFPADGAYTIRLRDMLDDADVATLAVTVVAA